MYSTPTSGHEYYFTRFGQSGTYSGTCQYDPVSFGSAYEAADPTSDFTRSDTALVRYTELLNKKVVGLDFLKNADQT